MKIGIPKEIYPGEKRVATTPEVAKQLMKLQALRFTSKLVLVMMQTSPTKCTSLLVLSF